MQAEATIPLTDDIPLAQKAPYQRQEVERNLEKPHYLYTALNTIDPHYLREHRERPELRAGGMIVSTPCLRHVDRFVRRGVITALLENAYDPVDRAEAEASDQKGAYLELPPLMLNGLPSPNPLKTRLAQPGRHLPLILNSSTNQRGGSFKGLVEIRDLRFMDYDPVELDRIQRAIYPTWPKLPVRIRDLRDMLNSTRNQLGTSSLLYTILEDMLLSCEQAEQYMVKVIDQVHFEMKHAMGQNGRVPQYTGLHLIFLEQLGLEPQARELQEIARPKSGDAAELFQLFREASREDRQEFIKALQTLTKVSVTETVAEEGLANEFPEGFVDKPTAKSSPEADTRVYSCECGEYSKQGKGGAVGLRLHQQRWCKLRQSQ